MPTVGLVPPAAPDTIATLIRCGGLVIASVRHAMSTTTDLYEHQAALCDGGALTLLVHHRALPDTNDPTGAHDAWRT